MFKFSGLRRAGVVECKLSGCRFVITLKRCAGVASAAQAGILFCGALLLLAGCTSVPNDGYEPPPTEWVLTNTVTTPFAPPTRRPANPPVQPVPAPVVRSNPPPKISQPAPVLTWTSLERWAAENKLAAPRKVASSPVASYAVSSPRGTLVLEIGSREATWRGLEMHLGFAPEIIDDQVFVHGLDLQKNLEPLLLAGPLAFGTNRVLVLDPGHGGVNSGTHSLVDGRFEKEFTLDWARRIQTLLATNGWTVLLTRTNDSDLALSNRVAFAEAHHADIFISLHFNSAAPDTRQKGLETYCLTPTGMPSTLTRGYRDQWTDHFPNNAFDAENLQLALRLHAALLLGSGEEDRGVRRARFMGVLLGQKRPAVLVEGGYLSNTGEAIKIQSPEFRQKLAEAVAAALWQPPAAVAPKPEAKTNQPAASPAPMPAAETNGETEP
ncbi:MAG TPA: N-acetylmuramoyl-L-alanine amidase [bacterium]|nr:N-acetylmuramoyl-L-alanine amidase [bacterium]